MRKYLKRDVLIEVLGVIFTLGCFLLAALAIVD